MAELSTVSKTLYIPMMGRVYATKYHPDILNDKKALSIAESLPNANTLSGQSEYTYLASAVRSKNIDHYVQEFLSKNPYGVIVNVGCGLETAFARNDNGSCSWYELDLSEVLDLREKYIPKEKGEYYLPYSMFDYTWIDIVKEKTKNPVLVIASGLFHYFKEEQVIDFIKHLKAFGDVQLVFDAASSAGIKGTKHYMKKMGKQDSEMFFSIDKIQDFVDKIAEDTIMIEERKYYSFIEYNLKMKISTKFKMFFSDLFNMVKMVHLKV